MYQVAYLLFFLISAVTVEVVIRSRVESATTANAVTLLCGMRDYIRPDEQFQWFRGEVLVSALNDRYSVRYVDGFTTAQNGLSTFSPSRLTGLVISNPVVSDTDTYTCAVNGTSQFATVELIVTDPTGEDYLVMQKL